MLFRSFAGYIQVRPQMNVLLTIAVSAFVIALPSWAQTVTYGSPSILSQCLDTRPSMGYGPTTRARECTRLFCARPEYLSLMEAYAMRRHQIEDDRKRALTCITRKEQDLREK